MPVFTSREQQCKSVKDKVSEKAAARKSGKTFLRAKKENKKVTQNNSEENLFRIRKKYLCKENILPDKSNNSEILKERKQPGISTRSSVVVTQLSDQSVNETVKSNFKRKIEQSDEELELSSYKSKKLQKLFNTTTSCYIKSIMYEYRSTNVSKNENESNYLTKSDAAEENLINAFYQQQCLGGSNNSIATLCNIGNSCYLNSVIYTLRFAPHFLHKLHHLVEDMRQVYYKIEQHKLKSSSLGRNISGIQNHNGRSWSSKDLVSLNGTSSSSNGVAPTTKSNRQIATEKLHELYQSLHRNESIDSMESFHAGTFLQAIQVKYAGISIIFLILFLKLLLFN